MSGSGARGRLYVGTSGFAYKTWKPDFYPADLKEAGMLRFYAAAFPSVEINASFYRIPSEKTLRGWLEETPEDFVFTLKASQKITHVKRLRDAAEPLGVFLRASRVLGERLGCILFQCPPNLRYAPDLLRGFLAELPDEGIRYAMEFRHESWSDPAVAETLAEKGIAFAIADGEASEALDRRPLAARIGRAQDVPAFVYLRLRRGGYDESVIDRWAAEVRPLLEQGIDAFVYLKHEDEPTAPRAARRLRDLTGT